jgi:DNA replication protein DnaC
MNSPTGPAYEPMSPLCEHNFDFWHVARRLRDVAPDSEVKALEERYRAACAAYKQPDSRALAAAAETELAELEARYAPQLAALEAKQVQRKRRGRLEALDIPVTASDLDLLARDALTDTRALKAVRQWHSGDCPLLVLSGPVGRGKSVAAAAALLECAGRYVRASTLARLYLAQFGDEVEQRERLVETDGVLVVDDIGTERNAEAMAVALVEVLDARRRGSRSLWITNLSRADFEQRYRDARLLSRLAQSAQWCTDVGADLRRAAPKGGE